MKRIFTLFFKTFLFPAFLIFYSSFSFSQDLFVGSGAEFYLGNNVAFTTSNSVISIDPSGIFSVEAGSNWGSSQEYVDGNVTAYGTGETILPTGNSGVFAPITANHTGTTTANYINATPNSGTNGSNVDAVSDKEYWELTGNAVITLPWNSASDITNLVNNNGGSLNSVSIVGYDGGEWNLVSAPQTNTVTGDLLDGSVTSDASNEVNLNTYSQFTFGIDHQVVLSVSNLVLNNKITILSNPIDASENVIKFSTTTEMKEMQVSLFDMMGRKVQAFNRISTYNGIGIIQKSSLNSGIYFVVFEHEGKQGIKKIIIE